MVDEKTINENLGEKINFKKIISKNTFSAKEKESIMSCVDKTIKKIDELLKKRNISAKAMLGGSSAKGTFLKGQFDCDVFVRFSEEYRANNESLPDLLEPIIKKLTEGKYQRVHGSRDYFQFSSKTRIKNANEIEFEIIPVLHIEDPKNALNITDSSPLHVNWIKNKIKQKSELKDQIILTKLFMKSQELYGAESYIRGFSGHVVDILTAYYGSFENLVKNSLEWKKKQIIDVENHYKNEKEALSKLNKAKISPLIVIDPVEKTRNAAASLSLEKFSLMKESSKAFLENPHESFFEKQELDIDKLFKNAKKENRNIHAIKVLPRPGKKDVQGAKLLKVFNHITKKLKENDFDIEDKFWKWDKKKCYMIFYLKQEKLCEDKIQEGPPLSKKINVNMFKIKYKETFEKDGRILALVKRRYTKPKELIEELLKENYVKEKIAAAKIIS
ncbi:MAG: nucleotidyltransferase domain-containing protein [Candidatus Woesearchaeota archaeon]